MRAEERLSPDACRRIREAIDEAGGDEIVVVGETDQELIVTSVAVVARGNDEVAPAPRELLTHDLPKRGRVVIHNHPTGTLRPSQADVETAAALGEYGVGSYIVDNAVGDLTVVCEPLPPRETVPLDIDALAAVIDDDGELSRQFDGFEPRPAQVEMLRQVARAFNGSSILCVEAGTGVGKSYAYLLPAITWAMENEERIVISTATINLQQQLVEKDIPEVQRLLGSEVPVVLVKGRGNYLCRKRLREALEEATLFNEPDDEIAALSEWAGATTTGSRSDAPFYPSDDAWSRVNSDADSCTELACRLRDDCFFLRARREAAAARVLIVNHHLLFIDLALRLRGIGFDTRAILPPFVRLIFDEAHSIENSATSLFSESLSLYSVRKHTRRLQRTKGRRTAGLLRVVQTRGADDKLVHASAQAVKAAEDAADALNVAVVRRYNDLTLRLVPGDRELQTAVLDPMRELHTRLVQLSAALAGLISAGDAEEEGGPYYDLRVVSRRIDRLAGLSQSFLEYEEHTEQVFWVEFKRRNDGSRYARFVSTPLDIREIMQNAVFDPFPTVVFTSATLTVADSFEFWSTRVGLADATRENDTVSLPSPFPFRDNALLAVPADAPPPSQPEYQAYLTRFVSELLELTEGHGLVLFTSFEMLRATHESVAGGLEARGIRCLRQGDEDRARLLHTFTADVSSVLFATESFWQGVDAPGDALQVVILCRLPFKVPTDPVLTARMEMIEARGGNAFAELALPEAVMKLRQGFGRLIRRSSDRGIVVITDVRVLTKSYGRLFLRSLPETQQSFKSKSEILEDVERFLYA